MIPCSQSILASQLSISVCTYIVHQTFPFGARKCFGAGVPSRPGKACRGFYHNGIVIYRSSGEARSWILAHPRVAQSPWSFISPAATVELGGVAAVMRALTILEAAYAARYRAAAARVFADFARSYGT